MKIGDTILSSFGGSLAGLFLIGCFFPWVNAKVLMAAIETYCLFHCYWIVDLKCLNTATRFQNCVSIQVYIWFIIDRLFRICFGRYVLLSGYLFRIVYIHWQIFLKIHFWEIITFFQGALSGCIISVVFVFWIAAGMTMSDGVKRTPRLPAAPTDQCFVVNHLSSRNFTTSVMYNFTSTVETLPESDISVLEPYVWYIQFSYIVRHM